MQTISPDLTNNIFSGVYLIFDHNALLISYVIGLLVCGFFSFFRPTRIAFAFTLCFVILTFGYEYDKHIIEPLRAQTLATLIKTPGTHVRAAKLIDLILSNFLPIFFFVVGWLGLLGSISYLLWNYSISRELVKEPKKVTSD